MKLDVAQPDLCQCGCGHPVTQAGNKWLRGHWRRKKGGSGPAPQSTEKDIITQDIGITQQILKQVLSGAGDSHTINVITIGQVRIENGKPHNGPKLQSSDLGIVLNEFTEPRLNNILKAVHVYGIDTGLLSGNDLENKVAWFAACERAVIDHHEEVPFS